MQSVGASLLSSQSQPAGTASYPRPWPMLQGRPGKSAEGTQWAFLEDGKSVHGKMSPNKPPLRWGQPGRGAGVCHSREMGGHSPDQVYLLLPTPHDSPSSR